jgi:hypothetical protein
MRRLICFVAGLCGIATVESFHTPYLRSSLKKPHSNLLEVEAEVTPPSIVFYSGRFPSEMYQGFVKSLRRRFDVTVEDDLTNVNPSIDCIVAHSIAANDVIMAPTLPKNTTLAFVDPTTYLATKTPKLAWFDFELSEIEEKISTFIEANKFKLAMDTLFKRPKSSRNKVSNPVLVINSKLSNRWKVIPPVPPPRDYALDMRDVSNKVVREIDGYGHFDIMDNAWANLGKRITTGTADDNVQQYHELVADAIGEFIGDNIMP